MFTRFEYEPGLLSRSRKELEVFEWSRSRIAKKIRSRIFYPTAEVQLN